LERTEGRLEIGFNSRGTLSELSHLYQRGCARARFPTVEQVDIPEAVIINTAGGLTGGDRVAYQIALAEKARLTVSGQAAEKIYRAVGKTEAVIESEIRLQSGAYLEWLPQETILFDRSRLARSIDVDMAGSARLLLVETIIFGRTAMGETVRSGSLRDKWRIRHGGKLVFAENIRLEGNIADTLGGAAIANGAQITSTIISVGTNAGDKLDAVRAALEGATCEVGASAWGPLLVVRALGRSAESVRRMHERVLPILSGEPLPRVWQS